jgi:O-antigen/teichoic acid export membrane protein
MNYLYKNMLSLASGSALAQLIPILAYPILTRIYPPEDFGTFATVILFSSLLGIVASGSYEHAILITKSKLDAANLVVLTLIRSSLVLLLFYVILFLTRENIAELFNDPGLFTGLLYVPFMAMGGILFACHSEWLVKYKGYGLLSRNRIFQGIFLVTSKVLFGISNFFNQALLAGEMAGRLMTSALSVFTILKLDYNAFRGVSVSGITNARSRFSRFPKVMVFDQFFNIFVGSVHVLFIGAAFGPQELGYVTLLFSSLYLPITVISTSIKDVFRQKANIDYGDVGSCRPLYLSLLKLISLSAVIPFTIGFFVAPSLFPIVFGEEWARVGGYAQIMIPMYYFNFVSMSLGGVLIFAEKINVSLYWQILSFIASVLALYIGCYVINDIYTCLILLAVSRALAYIAYGILSYYFSLNHSRLQS